PHHRHPDGNRRRLRRQNSSVLGALGPAALPQKRPPRENVDEPLRSVPGDGARRSRVHPAEDGGEADGEITAAEHYLVYDAGGFPGSPVKSACVVGLSPYRIPNFKIDGF